MREEVLLLLRFWRNGAGAEVWRVSLEDLRTKKTVRFANLEALLRYLETHDWYERPEAKESSTR
jgi:hypothetical protein